MAHRYLDDASVAGQGSLSFIAQGLVHHLQRILEQPVAYLGCTSLVGYRCPWISSRQASEQASKQSTQVSMHIAGQHSPLSPQKHYILGGRSARGFRFANCAKARGAR